MSENKSKTVIPFRVYKYAESSKKRRKIICGKKKVKDDKNLEKEGEQYKTDAF